MSLLIVIKITIYVKSVKSFIEIFYINSIFYKCVKFLYVYKILYLSLLIYFDKAIFINKKVIKWINYYPINFISDLIGSWLAS